MDQFFDAIVYVLTAPFPMLVIVTLIVTLIVISRMERF